MKVTHPNWPQEDGERSLVCRSLWLGLLAALIASLSGACITGTRRGYPLYPNPPLLAQQQVAFLTGYVQDVDGQSVSERGQSFDLLPGCHVVGTPSKSGTMDPKSGVVITTGPRQFAIPMKAAHSYVVEVGPDGPFSPMTGPAHLWAREIDDTGKTTRRFFPAGSLQDFQDCTKEAQR